MLVNIKKLTVDIDLIGDARRRGQKGFALGFKYNSLGAGLVRGLTRHQYVRGYLMLGLLFKRDLSSSPTNQNLNVLNIIKKLLTIYYISDILYSWFANLIGKVARG